MRVMYCRWRAVLYAAALWCFLTLFTYVCLKEESKVNVPHKLHYEPNDMHLRVQKKPQSYRGDPGTRGEEARAPPPRAAPAAVSQNYSAEVWKFVNKAVKLLYMNKDDSVESVFEKLDIDAGGDVEGVVKKVLTKLQHMARKPWRPPGSNETEFAETYPPEEAPAAGSEEKTLEKELSAWKRSMAYCNPPQKLVPGEEGTAPADVYTLENVHVVIRHGDRSPMYTLPHHAFLRLSCDVTADPDTAYYNLTRRYLTDMEILLEDSPSGSSLRRFGVYPHSNMCVGAQLTGSGALQHLVGGSFLHDAYVRRRQLVSPEHLARDIHIRSTEYTRTYQSAMAFLYGLLQDVEKVEAVPIHLSSYINFCSTELTGLPCNCPMVGRMKGVVKKEQEKRNHTVDKNIKADVSRIFDTKTSKLPWVGAILEVVLGYVCHDYELPCHQSEAEKCVTWGVVEAMWRSSDSGGKRDISSYAQHKLSRLQVHPLLHEIAHRMLNRTRGFPGPKLVLYSGHDKTITPLLKALGIYDGLWPPYGSRVVFETYSRDKEFFLKVLYNGRDKTRELRFCADLELVDGMCPLDSFVYFVLYRDIQFFKKATYADACAV